MGARAAGRRVEGGPGLGDEDLGALPEVYCPQGERLVGGEGEGRGRGARTGAPAVGDFVPEGGEGGDDHLDQVERGALPVELVVEAVEDALKRPAEL